MPRRFFPKFLVVLLLIIFIVQIFALKYYWYWTMRWFDMPMHFAGGVWLAGAAIWWRFFRDDSTESPGLSRLVVWGVFAAFVVGFSWEIYESSVSFLVIGHINDIIDTGSDILFDVLGGLVFAICVYWAERRILKKRSMIL